MTAIALLVATAVVTLVLARLYHLDAAALEVAIIGGVPGLYLVWATYRDDRRAETEVDVEGLGLAQVADELAAAIRAQWLAEAAVRRLNDPYPLPVRWVADHSGLAADWKALTTLATTGAGWPAKSHPWASSPAELAGQGNDIADVLARVPTGRLVILGEPGTGKTMLVVRLLLDLIARREPGGPVPVLVSLASWDPSEQSLHEWLITRLALDYHALAAPSPDDARGTSWIRAMLAHGRILPILDGLDEMPDRTRGSAITLINDALRPGEQAVVSSRGAAYRRAVRPEYGPGGPLLGAAVIELCPLQPAEVSQYLLHDGGNRARWEPVLAALGTDAPVGQALTTPLTVALARTIYNPRPGEYAGMLRDPFELCDPALRDRSAVVQHLFEVFIPAAYSHLTYHQATRRAWTADKAEHWLVFLARHVEHTVHRGDFAWWLLERAAPRIVTVISAVMAAVLGLALGIIVAVSVRATFPTLLLAMIVASLAGICAVLASYKISGGGAPISGVRWRMRGIHRPIRSTRVRLAFAALLIIPLPGLIIGKGFIAGVGWLLVCVLMLGMRGVYGGVPIAPSPLVTLRASRRSALIFWSIGLIFGSASGLAYGYAVEVTLRAPLGSAAQKLGLIIGLISGILLGLGFSLVRYAWPRWVVARLWLAFTHRLPWAFMRFLEDAHKRGVLRQAGAFYQFRHVELQRRLADGPSQFK